MPSSRPGSEASRRRARRSMREASENSTTASVASASLRTVELVGASREVVEHQRSREAPDGDDDHRRRDRGARPAAASTAASSSNIEPDRGEAPLHGVNIQRV